MKAKAPKAGEAFDYIQKLIIIGDSGVGKSNLLLRFTEGKFADNYMMTIGLNYVFKVVTIQGVRIKLQIWDTAGQDKYKTITKNYYRNSQGVIVVFAIDDKESFRSLCTAPARSQLGRGPLPLRPARRPAHASRQQTRPRRTASGQSCRGAGRGRSIGSSLYGVQCEERAVGGGGFYGDGQTHEGEGDRRGYEGGRG